MGPRGGCGQGTWSLGTLGRAPRANQGQNAPLSRSLFDSGTGLMCSTSCVICSQNAAWNFHLSLCSVPYFPIPFRMLGVTINLVTTSLTLGITTNRALSFCRVRTKSIHHESLPVTGPPFPVSIQTCIHDSIIALRCTYYTHRES
jgi:hypothetical protein